MPLKVTPRVKNFQNSSYYEEYLSGNLLREEILSKDLIIEMALVLKKIHEFPFDKALEKYLKNEFLVNEKYDPTPLLYAMLERAPKIFLKKYKDKLKEIYKELTKYFNDKKYNLVIIHGDLSPNNLIVANKRVKLIDWTDCRKDIPSADVAQLFYLTKMSKDQQKVFLEYYDNDLIDEKVLWSHNMLHYIYDLVNYFIQREIVFDRLIRQIDLSIQEYERLYQRKRAI